MLQHAYTIFLPPTGTEFGIYPHLLEEIHQDKCVVLRSKELVSLYVVGWYEGELDWQRGQVEIYYVASRMHEVRALCVRMSFEPPGSPRVVEVDWLPPGLRPLDEIDLVSRYGRALRRARFQPRLLSVRGDGGGSPQ